MLDPETRQTITMLHDHCRCRRVGQQASQPATFPVHPRPRPRRQPRLRPCPCPVAHSVSRATCRSRSLRWSCDDTRAYSTVRSDSRSATSTLTRISLPDPLRRDRQGSLPEPAIRREHRHPNPVRPLRQVHAHIIEHTYDNHTNSTDNSRIPPCPARTRRASSRPVCASGSACCCPRCVLEVPVHRGPRAVEHPLGEHRSRSGRGPGPRTRTCRTRRPSRTSPPAARRSAPTRSTPS